MAGTMFAMTFAIHDVGVHDFGLFALTILVLNATPGVDMMLTITSTLRQGIRAGLLTAAGICSGCVVHTLGAAFGLAAVLAASATAFTVVKWAGAAYLAWLAIGMWRQAWATPTEQMPVTANGVTSASPHVEATAWRLFCTGWLTNVLNPKVALFFLALLPQFIDADAPDKMLAFLVLGAWFIVQGYLFLAALVLLLAPLRRWNSPGWMTRALHAVGGTLFLALAARLAATPRT